jgi:hypothetical protein
MSTTMRRAALLIWWCAGAILSFVLFDESTHKLDLANRLRVKVPTVCMKLALLI